MFSKSPSSGIYTESDSVERRPITYLILYPRMHLFRYSLDSSTNASLNMLTTSKKTIKILHECEGGIEKSVPRITDWHHEACRDGYLSKRLVSDTCLCTI